MESSKLSTKKKVRFEPFRPDLVVENFDCGDERLNTYLKKRLIKDQAAKACAGHCLIDSDTKEVLGFYTLSSSEVDKEKADTNYPYQKVPVTRLGRLALHVNLQGRGQGINLVAHAMMKVASISNDTGVYALVVDAVRNKIQFYNRAGFVVIEDNPGSRTVFMALKVADFPT